MKSISKNKLPVIQLIIAVISAFIVVFGLSMFNQYLLMSFSLPIRMVLMIVTQWLMLIGPGVLMFVNKEELTDIGLERQDSCANRDWDNISHCHVVGSDCCTHIAWF